MMIKVRRKSLLTFLSFALGLGLLILSWGFLYVFLLAWTEGVLAPWDIVDTHEPPPGTLPRELNDFFEGPIGAYVPSVLVVLGGVLMVVLRLVRRGWREAVVWSAVGANGAFLVGLFPSYYAGLILEALGSWVTRVPLLEPRFPFGVFGMTFVLWIGYLIVQGRGFGFLALRPIKA